jgi:hypothetical protein
MEMRDLHFALAQLLHQVLGAAGIHFRLYLHMVEQPLRQVVLVEFFPRVGRDKDDFVAPIEPANEFFDQNVHPAAESERIFHAESEPNAGQGGQ